MSHLHNLIDFTVEVFIVYENKVLLRKHDKYKKWLSVGGHVELNEDPNQAAVREVKEEIGLEIVLDDSLKPIYKKDDTQELIPPYFLNRHRIGSVHEHVTFVYFAKTNNNKITQDMKDEQSEECRWFTKEELEQSEQIIPNIKFYALKALEKLSDGQC
jgi:ADP-ribose pyrophosphatase YjhB (NUDIX family)